jgi:hypothetical protein
MMHHGVLGAVGGCVAGHVAHKHQQRAEQQRDERGSGSGYPTPTRGNRTGY